MNPKPKTFKDVQQIMKQELGDKGSRKEQTNATGQMESTPRSLLWGASLIELERNRQLSVEGYDARHDATHNRGELICAAIAYASVSLDQVRANLEPDKPFPAIAQAYPNEWPWGALWWKPDADPTRNLVKAGALLAAEIDRLLLDLLPVDAQPDALVESPQGIGHNEQARESANPCGDSRGGQHQSSETEGAPSVLEPNDKH